MAKDQTVVLPLPTERVSVSDALTHFERRVRGAAVLLAKELDSALAELRQSMFPSEQIADEKDKTIWRRSATADRISKTHKTRANLLRVAKI